MTQIRALPQGREWATITAARAAQVDVWYNCTEKMAQQALDAVPPIYMKGYSAELARGWFMGEPAAHDERGVAVHAAFVKIHSMWFVREIPLDKAREEIAALAACLLGRK